MRVVEISEFGGPDVLRVAERPDPTAGPGEVVVRIHAAAVNPVDLPTRSGHARVMMKWLEAPVVPGWDFSGVVTALGPDAAGFDEGDRVAGMIPFGWIKGRAGAYAEAAAVETDWIAPIPSEISFEDGAAFPMNALTARQGLDVLALEPSSRLLVTGASGAVGGFAVQLAAQQGATVIAIAGTDDEDWVRSLGASEVLPRDVDLATIEPVDAVFDAVPLGVAAVTPCLRDGGAAVFTIMQDTSVPERGHRLENVFVRPNGPMLRELAKAFGDGLLRTRVAQVLPFSKAPDAHRLLRAGGLRGKLVLRP
jgi:NADPH:quinone reductase-like Zn-dependent oxidoreductase